MDETIYNEPWKVDLHTLIQQARQEGKWLRCGYQDLWFAPDRLEDEHRNGKFMWGVVNWQLREPTEQLEAAERRAAAAIAERDRVAARMPDRHGFI